MSVCYRNESRIVILSSIISLHGDEETGAIRRESNFRGMTHAEQSKIPTPDRLDGRGVGHIAGSLAKIERRYRARQKHLPFRGDDRAPEEGHRCERHKVFQRNRPGLAYRRRWHQDRTVHSFGALTSSMIA